jgi:hypothetical protein
MEKAQDNEQYGRIPPADRKDIFTKKKRKADAGKAPDIASGTFPD